MRKPRRGARPGAPAGRCGAALALVLLLLAPAALAQVPQAALYQGVATLAALDDPLHVFSNPAGVAFLEGRHVGWAATARKGQPAEGASAFAHAAAVAVGGDGRGLAFWIFQGTGGLTRAGDPFWVLDTGYDVAFRVGPAGLGAGVRYRRVEPPAGGAERPAQRLGIDVGLVAALRPPLGVGLTVRRLVEIRQGSFDGLAGPEGSGEPIVNLGVAYRLRPWAVMEVDGVDLFGRGGGVALGLELRLYPSGSVALRLGADQVPGWDRSQVGWLAGVALALPGLPWVVSYGFLGGTPYGGVHQIGVIGVGI